MVDNQEPKNEPSSNSIKKFNYIIQFVGFGFCMILPFLLFFVGEITKENINRLGIILNVAAGFMVAPDLIGIERLKRYEIGIESTFSSIFNRVDRFSIPRHRPNEKLTKQELILLVIVQLIIFSLCVYLYQVYGMRAIAFLVYYFIGVLFFVVFLRIIFSVDPQFRYYSLRVYTWQERVKEFFKNLPLIYVRVLSYLPFVIFFIPSQFLLIFFLFYLKKQLEGEERLKSILIQWGIFFFVLGNMFQFAATF